LSNLAALLRMNLFVYRDLWEWLETVVSVVRGPASIHALSRVRYREPGPIWTAVI